MVGLMLVFSGVCLGQTPIPKGWENLQKFYDEHEVARDFMPFGFYGHGLGSKFAVIQQYAFNPPLFNSARVTAEMHFSSLIDLNFNSMWGGLGVTPDKPKLSDEDLYFYETLLPRYEFKTLPSGNTAGFNHREFRGETPQMVQKLNYVKDLAHKYPQHILGFVTDDEPDMPSMGTAVACARLVEKYTGLLATFTTPNFYNINGGYAAQMMPITGDLYYCSDAARNSWKIHTEIGTLRTNFPGRLFWLMPNVTAWGAQERTLPDQPDARPLRTDLRLQCWSALAMGTKGFYFFQQGELYFQWGEGGQDGVFDTLKRENDHDPRQNMAAELREIGRDFTTIGPSLLTAYPAVTPTIPIACEKVRFPFFRGPALDCGLLRDARAGRDFLVPWNNDLNRDQAGTLTVPAELLAAGRKVYDLHALTPVELGAGNTFRLALPPGGGHVYLVGDAKAFDAVRANILGHRVRPERVKARVLVQRRAKWPKTLSFEKADGLIAKAEAAEKGQDWAAAAQAYRAAVADMEAKWPLAGIDATLEKAGAFLSRGDDMLRTHGQTLYNIGAYNYRGYGMLDQVFGNLPIKKEVDVWLRLGSQYISMKEQFYAGEVNWDKLDEVKAASEKLVTDSEALVKALQANFDQKLKEVRKPYRVAYVTSDREGIEEIRTYAWAYRAFNVSWIAPDAKGVLCDRDGKAFAPADYDVVWLHQLMSRQTGDVEVKPDPDAVLIKPLLEPAMIKAMKEYVGKGGGLFLTGISGLYALTLGVEKTPPATGPFFFHENQDALAGYKSGIAPAVGAEKHPLFAHVPPNGLATNGGFPGLGWCASTEFVWTEKPPTGTPLANVCGGDLKRTGMVAATEYALDKGKILLLGGSGFSLTPGLGNGNNPAVTRQIALDGIGYL
ncbi:MAG: hypothetical protein WCI21_04130, partial [Alphaproteobacteria bacterium]